MSWNNREAALNTILKCRIQETPYTEIVPKVKRYWEGDVPLTARIVKNDFVHFGQLSPNAQEWRGQKITKGERTILSTYDRVISRTKSDCPKTNNSAADSDGSKTHNTGDFRWPVGKECNWKISKLHRDSVGLAPVGFNGPMKQVNYRTLKASYRTICGWSESNKILTGVLKVEARHSDGFHRYSFEYLRCGSKYAIGNAPQPLDDDRLPDSAKPAKLAQQKNVQDKYFSHPEHELSKAFCKAGFQPVEGNENTFVRGEFTMIRQYPIPSKGKKPWRLDFAFLINHKVVLDVEVDGFDHHNTTVGNVIERRDKDRLRDDSVQDLGIKVTRIPASNINRNANGEAAAIIARLERLSKAAA